MAAPSTDGLQPKLINEETCSKKLNIKVISALDNTTLQLMREMMSTSLKGFKGWSVRRVGPHYSFNIRVLSQDYQKITELLTKEGWIITTRLKIIHYKVLGKVPAGITCVRQEKSLYSNITYITTEGRLRISEHNCSSCAVIPYNGSFNRNTITYFNNWFNKRKEWRKKVSESVEITNISDTRSMDLNTAKEETTPVATEQPPSNNHPSRATTIASPTTNDSSHMNSTTHVARTNKSKILITEDSDDEKENTNPVKFSPMKTRRPAPAKKLTPSEERSQTYRQGARFAQALAKVDGKSKRK